ncbi:hypothetical protein [Streptomyces sp. NRRL F-2799]|nr:hypothetical protein [Streptomyces sp. NRRL F-2799]
METQAEAEEPPRHRRTFTFRPPPAVLFALICGFAALGAAFT